MPSAGLVTALRLGGNARCISRLVVDPRRSPCVWVLRVWLEERRDITPPPWEPVSEAFEPGAYKTVSIPVALVVNDRRTPGASVGDHVLDAGDSGCVGPAIVEERARRVLGDVVERSDDVDTGESSLSCGGYC